MQLCDYITEKSSLWEELEEKKLPIVLHGMGDGAVKLLDILTERGLKCDAVFASDGFVRHQNFMGYTVKSLSEVEQELGSFTVLTAFATRLENVSQNIRKVACRHPLFAPDINVYGDHREVFDVSFYNKFYTRLNSAFNMLSDENSRLIYASLINYKLSGKLEHLDRMFALSNKKAYYDYSKIISYADLGAYNGDTLREAAEDYQNLKRAVALEPDEKNFKKLLLTAKELSGIDTHCYNSAAWHTNTTLTISEGAGRNSSLNSSKDENLQKKKQKEVNAISLDSIYFDTLSLIKYDVEGSELSALRGSRNTIDRLKPVIRLSIYHNNRDLFTLFEEFADRGYKMYLNQKCFYIPAWDVELIAVSDRYE